MKTDIHPDYGFYQVWKEISCLKEFEAHVSIFEKIWPIESTVHENKRLLEDQINEQILHIIWEDIIENTTFINNNI